MWNAGREHDVVNIFYTESGNEPTDESFYKTLPRQNKAIIEIGEIGWNKESLGLRT